MEFKGTKGEIHAVEYAGVIFMQDSEFYEDSEKCNILDYDHVGKIEADANGKLFECASEAIINLNISNEMLRSVLSLFGKEMSLITTFGINSQIHANDELIKKATTI